MEYKEKFNNILCYLNKCGMSEETATKKASELLESGDCSSLFVKKFNDKTQSYDVVFLENFTGLSEYLGWMENNKKQLLEGGYTHTLFLKANDPFYNSILGQIPEKELCKCCTPVQDIARQGM